MKNIALIIAGKNTTVTSPNLGVCYLASYLRSRGFGVTLVDEMSGDDFFTKVKKADFVGISSITGHINRAFWLADEIKKKLDVPIVIGGPHVTALPELTMRNKNIDYAVLGEGELPLEELMNDHEIGSIKGLCYREDDKFKVNEVFNLVQDIDNIPSPALDLLNMDYYMKKKDSFPGMDITTAPLMTSRGCPFRCAYCSNNVVRGRGMRYNSIERVMEEIMNVVKVYKPQSLIFWDDLFMANRDRLFDICERMIAEGLNKKLVWTCQSRVDTLDDDTLKALKEAGCTQLQIGFESGCQKTLDYMKCKTVTVEQNQEAFDLCKKHKMRVLGFFILGCPNESMEDLNETAMFIRKNPIDFTVMSIATSYPGTRLWDDYLKATDKDASEINWNDFWYGKATFFVPPSMEKDFAETWKKLNRDMSLRNYSHSPLLLAKRFLMRPTDIMERLTSNLKNTKVETS